MLGGWNEGHNRRKGGNSQGLGWIGGARIDWRGKVNGGGGGGM